MCDIGEGKRKERRECENLYMRVGYAYMVPETSSADESTAGILHTKPEMLRVPGEKSGAKA